MIPFPWDEALKFGFGTLKLSPKDFWGMTPRELSAAYEGAVGGTRRLLPPNRDDFEKLTAAFPDTGELRSIDEGFDKDAR